MEIRKRKLWRCPKRGNQLLAGFLEEGVSGSDLEKEELIGLRIVKRAGAMGAADQVLKNFAGMRGVHSCLGGALAGRG